MPKRLDFTDLALHGLPTHLAHALKNERAVAIHAFGPPLERGWQDSGEARSLFAANIAGRSSVIGAARRICTIYPRTPFDNVEVELENALLAKNEFSNRHEGKFRTFAEDGA